MSKEQGDYGRTWLLLSFPESSSFLAACGARLDLIFCPSKRHWVPTPKPPSEASRLSPPAGDELLSVVERHGGRLRALSLSRAAVLAALFVLAWRQALRVVLPGFDATGTPHHYLGQKISVGEVLAVIAFVSFVLARLPMRFRLGRGPLVTFAAAALALAGLAGASSFWALYPGLAVVQGAHLVIWVAFALTVAGARVPPHRMAATFVLGLLVQATVGFAQVVVQNHVGLSALGELKIPPDDPLKYVTAGSSLFLRAYGLSPHPNVLAGHLAVGLILCWGLVAGRRPVGRGLVAVTWTVLFTALLLTFSRSGLLGAVLGMTMAAIWLRRAGVLGRRPTAGLGYKLAVTAAVMIAVFAYSFSRYLPGRIPSMDALRGSDIRFVLINEAIKLITNHPLVGVGAGNFSVATRATTSDQTAYDAVHNIPLLIQAELGVVGLAAVAVMVAVLVAVGYRRWRDRSPDLWYGLIAGSLMALVTVSLFDHYLWTRPEGGLMGAWLVGWWLADELKDASPG